MSISPAALFDFDFFEVLPIQIEVSEAGRCARLTFSLRT